jgi:hypothetical protein
MNLNSQVFGWERVTRNGKEIFQEISILIEENNLKFWIIFPRFLFKF